MGPKDPYYKATAKTPEEEPVVSKSGMYSPHVVLCIWC